MGLIGGWLGDRIDAVASTPAARVFESGGPIDSAIRALPLTKSEATAGAKAAATAFVATGGNPVAAAQAGLGAAVAQHKKDQDRAAAQDQASTPAPAPAPAPATAPAPAPDTTLAPSSGSVLPVLAVAAVVAKLAFF